ncbi:hypothetical protein IWQ57_004671, partial [Coemansia nantahalensis]
PPRRQSVPTVRHSPAEVQAAKRATIMDPGCPDFDLQKYASPAPEKPQRRQRTLGTALTSVRRFFGGGSSAAAASPNGHKRWLGVPWVSGSGAQSAAGDAPPDSALASAETANGKPGPGYSRRVTNPGTSHGLGIAGSPHGGPHRRSMSESPGVAANTPLDPVGLAAVPEEPEQSPQTPGSPLARDAQPPTSAKSATSTSTRSALSGSIAPLQHSIDLHPTLLGAADSPFANPFQPPGLPAPYGAAQVDSGDEVQLTIEVCKIKNLSNFFIVHVARRKGNVWAYKHLYHLIMESLALRSDDVRRYGSQAQ